MENERSIKDFPKSKGDFKRMICKVIDMQYDNGLEPYLMEEKVVMDSFEFYSWITQVKFSITFEKKHE